METTPKEPGHIESYIIKERLSEQQWKEKEDAGGILRVRVNWHWEWKSKERKAEEYRGGSFLHALILLMCCYLLGSKSHFAVLEKSRICVGQYSNSPELTRCLWRHGTYDTKRCAQSTCPRLDSAYTLRLKYTIHHERRFRSHDALNTELFPFSFCLVEKGAVGKEKSATGTSII